MEVIRENSSNVDQDKASHSTLDAHLENMPTEEWWEDAYQSFHKLEQLIQPSWMAEKALEVDEKELGPDSYTRNMKAVRAGSLPYINVMPAGNHQLQLTATNEPLECVALGTMGARLFVELFWEAVTRAQQAGDAIVIHEVQSFVPRFLLTIGSHEFELKYMQCEALVRRYPSILSAPTSFLDDRNNCSQNVQNIVNDLVIGWVCLDQDHRRAYYYVRTWGIAKGLFNTKFNSKDFVRICRPDQIKGSSNIMTHFFREIDIIPGSISNPSTEEDWERLLLEAENEPFHERMWDFTYFIRVALMYTGSSKAKGGEWLSMVDRKVVKLRERLEARMTKSEIRIWPQRLVSSKTDPNDDIYEGYVVMGMRCSEADIPLAKEVSERWKIQVEEDTPLKNQCFIDLAICRQSAIAKDNLQPCTRVWPKSVVKPEENRSKQENDSEDADAEKTPSKKVAPPKSSVKVNDSGVKGAKLRSASDVLNRLRYDRDYNIDDCIIGYKDRHTSKIKEKPAADWATETTDEEFIPEHRIEYFKKDGDVIWDKSSRVDKVFKSGN